jgi:hypothetical protein
MRTTTGCLLVLVAAVGCGSKGDKRDAWPVGILAGGICRYDGAPTVAQPDGAYARLIGEGSIVEDCGGQKRTIDVLKPTSLAIEGPATVKVGEKVDVKRAFDPRLMAGARPLDGVSSSNASTGWTPQPDCAGVATLEEPLGAQDTGGRELGRRLVALKPGPCTLDVELLGLHGKRTITVVP